MSANELRKDYVVAVPLPPISEEELNEVKSELIKAALRERHQDKAGETSSETYSKSGGYIKTAYSRSGYSKSAYSRSAYIRG